MVLIWLGRSKMLENIEEAFDTAYRCSWGVSWELGLRAKKKNPNVDFWLFEQSSWKLHQQWFVTAKLVSTWESRSRLRGADVAVLHRRAALRPLRPELGISVDPAAGAHQRCRATSRSASHRSLSTSLSLLLSERSAYIQEKESRPELFFDPLQTSTCFFSRGKF